MRSVANGSRFRYGRRLRMHLKMRLFASVNYETNRCGRGQAICGSAADLGAIPITAEA